MRVLELFTSGVSCGLLRDLPLALRPFGVELVLAAAPAPQMRSFQARTGVSMYEISMTRAVTPVRDLIATVRLWALLRRLRPDLVHTHTPKASLLGAIAARSAHVPLIHTVHGLPHLCRGGLQGWLLRVAELVSCKLALRVICVSPSIRDVLVDQRLCTPEKAVAFGAGTVVGIDAESHFNPERLPADTRARIRSAHAIPAEALVVGYCGRVVRDKGISELAEAWTRLRDSYPGLYLLVVGPFEQEDPLPGHTLQILYGDPRIVLTHEVADPVLCYAAMDLLVLPSYREGFGMVAAEANAMGLPVIATDIPGCVDTIAAGHTGILIPSHDGAALAKAIALYLDNPGLRELHGRQGRARVLQHFRPNDRYAQMYAEYRRVVGRTLSPLARECVFARNPVKTGRLWDPQLILRFFDLISSCCALILLGPPLAAIAAVLALSTKGSPLFVQRRVGKDQKIFKLYKFRTMVEASQQDGTPLPDEVRLTKLGKFLRSTSLDELPQLWNVLKGDMSLVGPRPLLPEYLSRYTAIQRRRHEVRPGLTGWAQVNGRNALGWDQKFELDVWYVDHRSVWLDLKILAMTAWKALKGEGISQAGHATMPEFLGTQVAVAGPATTSVNRDDARV